MNTTDQTSGAGLDPIIMDGDEIIGVSGAEIEISEADQSQKKSFQTNVENYENSLSVIMREKAMISIDLYNKIINALKQGRGGKKVGIDVKFYSWCKTHFKIILNVDVELLCSVRNGKRIAVTEDYYEVVSSKIILKNTNCFSIQDSQTSSYKNRTWW